MFQILNCPVRPGQSYSITLLVRKVLLEVVFVVDEPEAGCVERFARDIEKIVANHLPFVVLNMLAVSPLKGNDGDACRTERADNETHGGFEELRRQVGQKRAAEYQVPIGAYVQVVEIFLRGDRLCVEMFDAKVDMGAIEVACTDL